MATCSFIIECLGDYCNCGETVPLDLVAVDTGVYVMEAEFNGVKLRREVQVIAGQPIVVPNIFNENYVHIVGFFFNGELVNGVKYSLTTVICLPGEEGTGGNTDDLLNSIKVIAEEGNTVVNNAIMGRTVTGVMINDISKNTDYTVSGNTLTFINGITLIAGDVVTIFFA